MKRIALLCCCLALGACTETPAPTQPEGPPKSPSHTLLGIDFTKPLTLPPCPAEEYDIKQECMKPSTFEGVAYQAKFPITDTPRFVDGDNEIKVATDAKTGNVDSVEFSVGDDDYEGSLADDALVQKFGPQTDSPDEAVSDYWHWNFSDYHITYHRALPYRYIEMKTTEAYNRDLQAADDEAKAQKAKL